MNEEYDGNVNAGPIHDYIFYIFFRFSCLFELPVYMLMYEVCPYIFLEKLFLLIVKKYFHT